MSNALKNLILIGMPGAGKSTIGVILAKQTARDFVDTDLLIQLKEGCCLQETVNEKGYLELRRIEGDVLQNLDVENHVVATGGSAVYSEAAMKHLKELGTIVYLKVSLQELESRVTNEAQRGLARPAEQTFAQMYDERCELYERYAQVTIKCDGKCPEQIASEVDSIIAD
ncbi:shikimate kinase [Rubinisphaera italica]|uniref:Shikimate kinase n=1 Tax=Rubinisphaera italica TaxID=2527969 RepID=A0A5C5XLS2_9PLAN|nr:shikimate kinase [Rubinisphaera italica]TWT63900.1 Shikimate kinase [Rubinisphaera italica]